MDKNELLELARAENVDEGELHAQSKGRFTGYIAFLVVYIFISTFNGFVGVPTNYAVHAMFMAFVAAESYPKWKFTKAKKYLLVTVLGGALTLLFLARFIFDTLGVVVA